VADARSGATCPESFVVRCSACHGVQGAGDGVSASTFRPPPRSFRTRGWDAGRSDETLAAVIREGGARHGLSAAMPAHPDLSDGEIRDLVSCVRGFQSRGQR
jgi:mono/diheme cytochrome c family protein